MQDILNDIFSSSVKNIIVDCDMGADGDDQFALAYGLSSPDKVKILSVNSAPFNEDAALMSRQGKEEIDKIISLSRNCNVQSYMGSGSFISKEIMPINSPAAENIIRTAEKSEGPIYVVVSGCCTNVASALLLAPEIKNKLVVIWLALSDIYKDGNSSEYNLNNDLLAGKILFDSGASIVLVPTKLVYPFAFSNEDVRKLFLAGDPLPFYLVERFEEIKWAKGLWDLGAAGVLICPEAYIFNIIDMPVLDSSGEVSGFDSDRKMIYAEGLDCDRVLHDAMFRISGNIPQKS